MTSKEIRGKNLGKSMARINRVVAKFDSLTRTVGSEYRRKGQWDKVRLEICNEAVRAIEKVKKIAAEYRTGEKRSIDDIEINVSVEPALKKKKASKTTQNKKVKKVRFGPKKPPTTYNLFVKGNRSKVKDENPNVSARSILGLVAQKWREASDVEKEPFVVEAKKAKVAYAMEISKREAAAALIQTKLFSLISVSNSISVSKTDDSSDDSEDDSSDDSEDDSSDDSEDDKPLTQLSPKNIIQGKRLRKATDRYRDPDMVGMYLNDIPAEEKAAAIEDEDLDDVDPISDDESAVPVDDEDFVKSSAQDDARAATQMQALVRGRAGRNIAAAERMKKWEAEPYGFLPSHLSC